MKVAGTVGLCLMLLACSSCAERKPHPLETVVIAPATKIYRDDVIKLNEDKKVFAQEFEKWSAKAKAWKQKEYDFMSSLCDEELKAYSELKDAYKQGNAKHLLAYRKFAMSLLQGSADIDKISTFNWLEREGGELIKQADTLDAKWQELEKRQKQLVQLSLAIEETKRNVEEERRHQEMRSAIRGIGSSLDDLRFSFDQWRMQQFLRQR